MKTYVDNFPPYSRNTSCDLRKQTNADRFRAKSDEELAEAITADWCSIVCPGGSFFCDGECKTKVLDWLRQEL